MTRSSPAAAPVTVRLGRLPPLWRESAIFFSNLDCIFFGHPEKTRQLIENVTGFHGYGCRLLPILGLMFRGNNNLLLLQEEPEPAVVHYFAKRLNLPLPAVEIIEVPPTCGVGQFLYNEKMRQRLRSHPAPILDGYITDPHLESMASDLGKRLINSHQSCRDANDKMLLNRFLQQAGLPAFDGGEAMPGRDIDRCFAELRGLGYRRAVVRSSLGASGFGMAIAELTDTGPPTFLEHLFPKERVLVQGWIEEGNRGVDRIFSPSVQFFCDETGKVTLYDITDQLLSRCSIHEGNLSPPVSFAAGGAIEAEILRQAEIVTSWVASVGYKGTGSIDFLICEAVDTISVYTCEVNARVTGATYPSLLAHHFNREGAWLMRNISLAPCMSAGEFLDFMERKGVLYLPGLARGILPLNLILDKDKLITKCQLLVIAGKTEECLEMIETFPALLPSSCVFDRD